MKRKICSVISILLSILCFCAGLVAFLIAAVDSIQISSDSVLAGQGFTSAQIAEFNGFVAEEVSIGDIKDDDTLSIDTINTALVNLSLNKDGVKEYKKIKNDTIEDLMSAAAATAKRTTCFIIVAIGIVLGAGAIVLLKFTGGPEFSKAPSLSNLAKVGLMLEVIIVFMYVITMMSEAKGL